MPRAVLRLYEPVILATSEHTEIIPTLGFLGVKGYSGSIRRALSHSGGVFPAKLQAYIQ